MGVWHYIISQTSSSNTKLVVFGGLCMAVTAVIGSIFTEVTAPAYTHQQSQKNLQGLPFDQQRFANAREQRLSAMLRDMVQGQGEQHWQAAMRGTLVAHPAAENKTQGIDNEVMARMAHKK